VVYVEDDFDGVRAYKSGGGYEEFDVDFVEEVF